MTIPFIILVTVSLYLLIKSILAVIYLERWKVACKWYCLRHPSYFAIQNMDVVIAKRLLFAVDQIYMFDAWKFHHFIDHSEDPELFARILDYYRYRKKKRKP